MFIQEFRNVRFISNSAQVKLPRPNLVLDPTANNPHDVRFDCRYHNDGITVTLTKIKVEFFDSTKYEFSMRVYDPAIEAVPDFDSTIYTYLGLDREHAPADTTVGIIDPSVRTIKSSAFFLCEKMKKCIMHDGVETIEQSALSLCTSLEALFLPSSLKNIEYEAFSCCFNIRILSIPINIDISQIGRKIIHSCDTFFQTTQIPKYEWRTHMEGIFNNSQVHQAFMDFYRYLPPLHKACLDVNVNVQTIHNCIIAHGRQAASITDHDGMTPLHILSLNPHASLGSIGKCLDADTSTVFVGDSRGNTPLDYLKEHNLAGHTWIVTALCLHRESMMR